MILEKTIHGQDPMLANPQLPVEKATRLLLQDVTKTVAKGSARQMRGQEMQMQLLLKITEPAEPERLRLYVLKEEARAIPLPVQIRQKPHAPVALPTVLHRTELEFLQELRT